MMFSDKENFFLDMYAVDEGGIRVKDFPGLKIDGEFHIDSFTYTPFIDHMSTEDGDVNAGSYAD